MRNCAKKGAVWVICALFCGAAILLRLLAPSFAARAQTCVFGAAPQEAAAAFSAGEGIFDAAETIRLD